jgi:hypothetical protein
MKVSPIFRRLRSLKDLARLACAFERIPRPLFAFPYDGKSYALAVHAEQLGDHPLFFFAVVDSLRPFVRYRSEGDYEDASFSDDALPTSYLHAPVLTVKTAPKEFGVHMKDGPLPEGVGRMELEDVNSLLKLGAYRYIVDESYPAFYLSTEGGDLYLGTFVHMGDFDGSDFYFYVKLTGDPGSPFIRYNPSKVNDWSFTSRTAEHGYYYVKVVRIAEGSF